MTVATAGGASRVPRPSSLADVLDVVLDKGIVIDAYIRVAVVGIELITIDARIVIASVDTYLRFAEAVNRLDLQPQQQVGGLPGLVDDLREGGAAQKTKGALSGVKESAKEVVDDIRDGEDEDERPRRAPAQRAAPKREPAKRTTPSTKRRRGE